MNPLHILTVAEQVAAHLTEKIKGGILVNEMPGVWKLSAELGVDHKSVQKAMGLLEKRGLVRQQGAKLPRRIILPRRLTTPRLQVKILVRDPDELKTQFFLEVQDSLTMAGHTAEFADMALVELKMDVGRVARYVRRQTGTAWVVVAGSREVLEWFAAQPVPTFALWGRLRGLPLAGAGTNKDPVLADIVRRLAAHGHRRMVYLVRPEQRASTPMPLVQTFLDEMKALGIPLGPYNLPNWEDNPKDFRQCLASLFQHTPPTALIIDELMLYHAAQHFLASQGIRPFRDATLISLDPIPYFDWLEPKVPHVTYRSRLWIRRLVNWANNVARGKIDRRQVFAKVNFVEGELGPPFS